MIFIDQSNFHAKNAIQGAISYIKKNNFEQEPNINFINVGDEEAFQTVEKGFLKKSLIKVFSAYKYV